MESTGRMAAMVSTHSSIESPAASMVEMILLVKGGQNTGFHAAAQSASISLTTRVRLSYATYRFSTALYMTPFSPLRIQFPIPCRQ